MLYIILSFLILFPTIIGIGHLTSKCIKPWNGLSGDFILGLLSIGFIWSILAFFIPLNAFVEGFTIASGLLYFFLSKKYTEIIQFLKKNYRIFLPFSGLIIFAGSFYPYIMDHYGYYVPTVKWISEIGMVKGISNLDLLLGQMSTWHILQAGFSNIIDPFLRLNTVLTLAYLLYIIEKKQYIHLLFLPILLLFVQSPSPDLPAIILSLIVLNELFLKNKNLDLLFLTSIFIFIIKPTMIWVPLMIILYGLNISKVNFRWLLLGSTLFVLFIIKNLFTFGFPVFPLNIIDFNLPWKPNAELLGTSSKTAIEKTYDLQYTYDEIKQFSKIDYVKNWFLLKGIKSKIHIGFIASLFVFLVYTILKKNKLITIICISLFIKSILVLIFSAQYRFFLDVFFAIAFVILYQQIKSSVLQTISVIGCFTVIIGLSFPSIIRNFIPSFKLGNYMGEFEIEQTLKPSEYKSVEFKSYQIGNLKFNIVDQYIFCFDVPLPAISPQYIKEDLEAGIFPQQISEDIKDGFIWKKITNEQKVQIENILKDWQQSLQNQQ